MLHPPFFQEYTPLNGTIRLCFVVYICYNLLAVAEKKWIHLSNIYLFINIALILIFISSGKKIFIKHAKYSFSFLPFCLVFYIYAPKKHACLFGYYPCYTIMGHPQLIDRFSYNILYCHYSFIWHQLWYFCCFK